MVDRTPLPPEACGSNRNNRSRPKTPPLQMWRHPPSAQAAPSSSWTRATFSFQSITRSRLIKEAARRSLLMTSLWSVHTSGCSPAFPTRVVALRRKGPVGQPRALSFNLFRCFQLAALLSFSFPVIARSFFMCERARFYFVCGALFHPRPRHGVQLLACALLLAAAARRRLTRRPLKHKIDFCFYFLFLSPLFSATSGFRARSVAPSSSPSSSVRGAPCACLFPAPVPVERCLVLLMAVEGALGVRQADERHNTRTVRTR